MIGVTDTSVSIPERPSPRVVPLNQLLTGERGEVRTTDLCDADCQLLRAMGIHEQCRLRVCRAGRRCIVTVNTTRLGLSPEFTQRILVAVDPSSD